VVRPDELYSVPQCTWRTDKRKHCDIIQEQNEATLASADCECSCSSLLSTELTVYGDTDEGDEPLRKKPRND